MRIFVGGLPRTATKVDVVRLFAQFGAGDADVVLPVDRRTRRRKGIAYVDIADETRARSAIAVFAGFALDGKPFTVCAAADRPLKRSRRKLTIVLALLSAAVRVTAPAQAAPLSTDIGLTLNPVLGATHESFNDIRRIPPVPIPLLEARARYGPIELDLGGLPALASVSSVDARDGHTSTQLSLVDTALRVWDPPHRLSVGIGQTLYNQSTRYADPIEIAGTGETQYSRVTGMSYQVGCGVPLGRGRFEGTVDYAPAMLGTQYTLYTDGRFRGRADPERATQVDTAVRYVRAAGHHAELIVGLRYVNYTAAYAERHGGLADRNAGLLWVIGYRARLKR